MKSPGTIVRLRYLQEAPIVVRGLISGRRYFFSGARPLNFVDARDTEGLMRSRLFRLEE
ncbi:MAG: hypothetical protein SF339_08415 [Blastocatellia bacterium]|nr:hypothetical protein [Blastocatellia bacterium]